MERFESIGARLREERERLGKSQTDFAAIAEAAGVPGATRQSQSLYEKGKRMPDAGYLAAVAAVGVDVLYVLTGSRSVSPSVKESQSGTEQWQRAVLWMARIAKASGIWETMSDQDAVELAMIIHRMLTKSSSQELGGGAVVSILEEWRKRKAG
ncbi:MAG: helix-turn-helix transcriptional regulator [Gammaproteobacteria bacterium]|nr:helix-turn-helix transcriptional regulator [Gammaproteobacteria bacterium]